VRQLDPNKTSKIITGTYFVIAVILICAEIFKLTSVLIFFKPLLIPTLMGLYYYTSNSKNKFYLLSLFFALCSNVFFLSTAQEFLLYGIIAFMFYRILTIVVVLKLITRLPLLPFAIACLPFIFIFSCLINLTMNSLSTSFYPAILNAVLISALAGISLSNYVLDDSRVNSWLAISTLLAIVLVYLFMIQKYYFPNEVFQPISAFIFAVAHYTFYKFVIESEKQHNKSDDN
jgi:hypothetical protein